MVDTPVNPVLYQVDERYSARWEPDGTAAVTCEDHNGYAAVLPYQWVRRARVGDGGVKAWSVRRCNEEAWGGFVAWMRRTDPARHHITSERAEEEKHADLAAYAGDRGGGKNIYGEWSMPHPRWLVTLTSQQRGPWILWAIYCHRNNQTLAHGRGNSPESAYTSAQEALTTLERDLP